MVTKQQAMNVGHCAEFHYGTCTKTIGPRGGVTYHKEVWRVNGACKTWKRNEKRFCLPIKYGLRSCSYLTDENASDFHLASECPVDFRFEVEEYASYFTIVDTKTEQERPMGDGVDSVFDEDGKALSPGSPGFIQEWEKILNFNPYETLEAYFPEQYKKEVNQE